MNARRVKGMAMNFEQPPHHCPLLRKCVEQRKLKRASVHRHLISSGVLAGNAAGTALFGKRRLRLPALGGVWRVPHRHRARVALRVEGVKGAVFAHPQSGASVHCYISRKRTPLPNPLPTAWGEGIDKSRGSSVRMRPPILGEFQFSALVHLGQGFRD
jgi:hypothetical protein